MTCLKQSPFAKCVCMCVCMCVCVSMHIQFKIIESSQEWQGLKDREMMITHLNISANIINLMKLI